MRERFKVHAEPCRCPTAVLLLRAGHIAAQTLVPEEIYVQGICSVRTRQYSDRCLRQVRAFFLKCSSCAPRLAHTVTAVPLIAMHAQHVIVEIEWFGGSDAPADAGPPWPPCARRPPPGPAGRGVWATLRPCALHRPGQTAGARARATPPLGRAPGCPACTLE